tara:strand:+ start:146 stop:463 length:318 start_codon:yes stop_codon:yes gene_type:complete
MRKWRKWEVERRADTLTQALAKSPLTKKYDLSSVTDIGSGAAPLGGDVIREAEGLWPSGDRKLRVSFPFLLIFHPDLFLYLLPLHSHTPSCPECEIDKKFNRKIH